MNLVQAVLAEANIGLLWKTAPSSQLSNYSTNTFNYSEQKYTKTTNKHTGKLDFMSDTTAETTNRKRLLKTSETEIKYRLQKTYACYT